MLILKNDRIYIEIAELGAEIRKLTFDGEDMIWSGDAKFWSGTAPVLFPICGALRDGKYTFDGKEYTMPKHGFACNSIFTVEKRGHNFLTLLLKATPETLEMYPFDFELRITYRLRGNALKVEYDVKNTDSKEMYFSVGAHEAYACHEGIEEYDIIFPQNETLDTCEIKDGILDHTHHRLLTDSNVLPLYTRYFESDSLIFKGLKSRSATLRNRISGKSVTVEFPQFDYFLVWTQPHAGFVCLEPWCGIPSIYDEGYEIEQKEGMLSLSPHDSCHREHTIYF